MNSSTPRLGLTVPDTSVPAPHAAAPAQRRPWLGCATLALFWYALTAGLRPLAIPDEGR